MAQKRQNVYFLTNNNNQVSTKDSADFIRIVSEPDSGSELYNVNEYYKNGKPKFIGKSWTFDSMKFEGSCISFFPSGKRQSVMSYKRGYQDGDIYTYYPNGKLYTIIGPPDSVKALQKFKSSYLIKLCNDSTGKNLAENGTGHFISYSDDFKHVNDKGQIDGGVKQGEWKGTALLNADTITYTETFVDGAFTSGVSFDKSGHKFTYKERQVFADFDGGLDKFYYFLANKVRYPSSSKENNIQGKVILKLIIEKDGSFSNIEVVSSPDKALAAEAVRVFKLSPKWKPAMMFGQPIKTPFQIPVNFSLGDK